MDRLTFATRLQIAAQQALQVAREHVLQPLPDDVAFLVYPNQSCDDNPRVGDEVVFPDDCLPDGHHHGPWSVEQVLDFLWREGKVPEWIDAAVEAEDSRRTLIALLCCGRFSAKEELLYHRRNGVAPLSIKSPYLPPGWESVETSGKFDLYWREQLFREPSIAEMLTSLPKRLYSWAKLLLHRPPK